MADVVATHPLHAILDPDRSPKSWEQKLLFLSDKMVKWDILTVDERFRLWYAEDLPPRAVQELDAAYPLVKDLEKNIFALLPFAPADVAILARG